MQQISGWCEDEFLLNNFNLASFWNGTDTLTGKHNAPTFVDVAI